MCEHGDTVSIWIPTRRAFGEYADVDRCVAPLVVALNAAGFETVASCCGHGHRPGSVILRDGRELVLFQSVEDAADATRGYPNIHGEHCG